MKAGLPLIVLLFSLFAAEAQIGLSGSYTWFNAPQWEEKMRADVDDTYLEEFFFQNGFQVGLDYWFRFKNVRIEFLPEARYARFEARPESFFDAGQLTWQSFSFHLNTNIYPFDFFGDCDCPTFSKQNTFFKKGFFLQVSPGVHYLAQSYRSERYEPHNADVSDWAYSIGLGAGLDIGISDWITLTPYGRFTRVLDGTWEDFDNLAFFSHEWGQDTPLEQPYALWIPEAGLRLGLRWRH